MTATHTDEPLTHTPVFAATEARRYSGATGDYDDFGHDAAMETGRGTLSLSFALDRVAGDYAVISKDLSGRDAGGGFTVWVDHGELKVSFESAGETEWLTVNETLLSAGTTYHLALAFGPDGLALWLDGALVAAEPEFAQGIRMNDAPLVVGASRSGRSSETDTAHSAFRGEIGNVRLYDRTLDQADMIALANHAAPGLGEAAEMQATMVDLAPLFAQLHHGSETLQEILADYGVDAHGHMHMTPETWGGGAADNLIQGNAGANGLNGRGGDDIVRGRAGDDLLQGEYGNDMLFGDNGDDILDGGHGEDVLNGGWGDDLLVSRADAREPEVWYDPDRDEMDPYGELTDGKLYPDQPIPGDDLLIGGSGADIFYFQTLINAKERYIEKHTRDDGSINWHGVAGENDNIHDHWVDHLGNDVIQDFSRAEGDRIVIEGHTTEIDRITYGDANGDGVIDHSVVWLYSDQGGGGGAHNDDRLGTVTVYGDLITEADIEHTAAPAYGIVATIDDLAEALAPETNGVDAGPIAAPSGLPDIDDPGLRGGKTPVFALPGAHDFSGGRFDYQDTGHHAALALRQGTIALSFEMAEQAGYKALISKDRSGRDEGGQFTLWLDNGILKLSFESETDTEWLEFSDVVLSAGQVYHTAVSFGPEGLKIWLDGALVAAEPEFTATLMQNDAPLVVGASRSWRGRDTEEAHSLFEGTIGDVMVYDRTLDQADMIALANHAAPGLGDAAEMQATMVDLAPLFAQVHHGSETLQEILADYGVDAHGHMHMTPETWGGGAADNLIQGNAGANGLNGRGGDDIVRGRAGDDLLQGEYGNDMLFGDNGDDILDGGHGEDVLNGGWGDDLLVSRADAREPEVFHDPDRDEMDPYGELTDGKLYPDQPIPGDDLLIGGSGADIFYFQTLINAKERYIEKHTRDDGSINWHGVAGENDNIHDHWVDHLGNDVIQDFSRAEGDRIVIEGHTTEIDRITYGDANGDGVIDHSVVWLYSDQGGGGGAHNDDRLGTVTVYGDLITEADIEHSAAPAYGIVATIDDLAEALAPETNGTEKGTIAPAPAVDASDARLAGAAPVFAVMGAQGFDPDAQNEMIFDHTGALSLRSGTFAFAFTADELGYQHLFSKDATGYERGGHLAAYIDTAGSLTFRFQDDADSHYYTVNEAVKAGVRYETAFSFGPDGVEVFLDGVRVAYDEEMRQGLMMNPEAVVLGATGWSSTPGTTDRIHSRLDGTIEDFRVFSRVLGEDELDSMQAPGRTLEIAGARDDHSFERLFAGGVVVDGPGAQDALAGHATDYIAFSDITVRRLDVLDGSVFEDDLWGSDGADILLGLGADDTIRGEDHDDLIRGGLGDDRLYGGDGDDTLEGGWGDDYMQAGTGNDVLRGGFGNDELKGEDGNDRFFGGIGDDTIYGHSWGEAGRDGWDRVHYDGVQSDYSFETEVWWNSTRGEDMGVLVVTDNASGGQDGWYEGEDKLIDIDWLIFADGMVAVDDLLDF